MTGLPRLDGVRALVTGGTSGLGQAMAQALVEAGATVAVTGRDAERTASSAAQLGATGVAFDVTDPDSVERGVAEAVERLGGLDVLVNNAGLGMRTVNPRFLSDPQPFWQVATPAFAAVIATNLTGYFLVARAAVPRMLDAGGGRVINVSMNTETRTGAPPAGEDADGAHRLTVLMSG